jgi:hypothetical protein
MRTVAEDLATMRIRIGAEDVYQKASRATCPAD